MKTIKIAVIALIGMNSVANAQTNKLEPTGNVGIGTTTPTYKVEWYNNTHKGFLDFTFTGIALGSKTGDLSLYSNGARRVFIGTNGNVGIGTTSPKESLDVNGSMVIRDGYNLSWGNTYGAGIPTIAGNTASGIHFYPNGSTTGATMRILKDGKTIFTNNMAVLGKIESKELKVTHTPTADFVFEEGYDLPSLKSIEKHIKIKKHLPEIASAKEMKKNGVNVGSFQIQLLQKIEELTLYTIEQEKEIQELKESKTALIKQQLKLEDQAKKIEKLESLVQKLLKDKK